MSTAVEQSLLFVNTHIPVSHFRTMAPRSCKTPYFREENMYNVHLWSWFIWCKQNDSKLCCRLSVFARGKTWQTCSDNSKHTSTKLFRTKFCSFRLRWNEFTPSKHAGPQLFGRNKWKLRSLACRSSGKVILGREWTLFTYSTHARRSTAAF